MDSTLLARAVVCAVALMTADGWAQSRIEPAATALPRTPSLADALAATLLASSELAAFALEERARDAAALQAGAWPNPELALELEDVAGTGDFSGTSEAQTTLGVFQRFELGGDRGARRSLAESERALAGFDYATKRLELLARTADAFVDALAAQARLALADEALRVAQDGIAAAKERARAGVASPAEEARAELARAQAEAGRARELAAFTVARERLAALCGEPGAPIDRVLGSLAPPPPLPELATLRARLAEGPGLARFESERAEREARVALERARRIPDVTLNAGVRRLSGPEETSLVLGAALPIPVWDRHAGAIAEAEHRVAKLARERKAAERALDAQLVAAHAALASARDEALALERSVLPQAELTLSRVGAAHRAGALSQLERLEAERVVQAVRGSYLRALTEAHHHAVEIERLTASLEASVPADGLAPASREEGSR